IPDLILGRFLSRWRSLGMTINESLSSSKEHHGRGDDKSESRLAFSVGARAGGDPLLGYGLRGERGA
ncbi:MAG: hypothetical protein ACYC4L_19160, partial [Chloroflexota bacterium]